MSRAAGIVHNAAAEGGTIQTRPAHYHSALAGVNRPIRLSNDGKMVVVSLPGVYGMIELEAPNNREYLLGSTALNMELERSMQINDVIPVDAAAAEAGNPVQINHPRNGSAGKREN